MKLYHQPQDQAVITQSVGEEKTACEAICHSPCGQFACTKAHYIQQGSEAIPIDNFLECP